MTCSCQNPQKQTVDIGGVTVSIEVRAGAGHAKAAPAPVETVKVFPGAGPGRRVSEPGELREPLLAVFEPLTETETQESVYACGECCDGAGSPTSLRFDKLAREGGLEAVAEVELPKKLRDAYSKRLPTCLPFVRITRDPERFRQCLATARAIGPIVDSEAVYKLVGEHLQHEDQEVFLVILLDTQLQVRGISELARGGRDRVSVPVPDVLRIAIVDGAMSFVVVHNHPSGVTQPSEADKMLTETLRKAAEKVQLQLLDHVIVGANGYYSFAEKGLL